MLLKLSVVALAVLVPTSTSNMPYGPVSTSLEKALLPAAFSAMELRSLMCGLGEERCIRSFSCTAAGEANDGSRKTLNFFVEMRHDPVDMLVITEANPAVRFTDIDANGFVDLVEEISGLQRYEVVAQIDIRNMLLDQAKYDEVRDLALGCLRVQLGLAPV